MILSAIQANSTVTPAVVPGMTFTLLPGKTLRLSAILVWQTAATTTGLAIGIRVAQGAGANGNARGSVQLRSALSGAAAATVVERGDVFNVAAAGSTLVECLGTGGNALTTNHTAQADLLLANLSTNANTTITVEFRSEIAASAVTLQIGSSAIAQST